jgi:preprotein translocase subunit SecF
MRLFANANYDLLSQRKWAYGISIAFSAIGLIVLLIRGVNYSVEFTGGTLIQVETQQPADVGALRNALQARGIPNAEIQTFGSDREIVVRARVAREGTDANDTQATAEAVSQALDATLGAGTYQILRTEAVGPKVGGELRQQAVLAILMSFIAVLAYLAYRFEWRFGVAAIVATAHDIIAAIAFIGLVRLEVSLFVVAGLLTIVGYSLNDTIVIFDRIRENLHLRKREGLASILNRSINETLPRTFFTGTTALGSLLALSILGGDVVRPFSLLMLFGVIVGTFSSIYIASPVLLAIETRWPGPDAKGHLGPKPAAPATGGRKPQPVG